MARGALVLLLAAASSDAARFVPHFRYYTPQVAEFLLDYVDPAPSLSYSMDPFPGYGTVQYKPFPAHDQKLPSFGGSANFNARQNTDFDPMARQPGAAPAFTGAYLRESSSSHLPKMELSQPGQAPRFTGSYLRGREDEPIRFPSIGKLDSHTLPDAAVEAFQGPVTNPAATFLEGTNFEKIATPKCRMVSCAGPVPNDGSASTAASNLRTGTASACAQVLVPVNGCVGGQGYPMAMLCTMCCECTAPLVSELLKTAKVYRPDNFQ